ncbi:carbon-nitrogen hydrolase family protein [Segniliparus rugosus]|uniref:carbon-nitrogen hydrolase family protein n=1 Tax=Segniliparus rugosus TaxID=286804 RepID=UPI00058C3356|nr:carbon-nitrogen hydrolase family protein [Segniliparus rugosus]
MRVALAQISSGPDPAANAALIAESARAAKARGAQLVVFPEAGMRCFGEPLAPVAEPVDGPWAAQIRALAAELGVAIVVGMFSPAEAGEGKVRNTLIATDGAQVWPYDKIHLFDALGFLESRTVEAGSDLVVFDLGPARIGLTTCYDVRFPWLYQELARLGAHALVVSASWGSGPRKLEQWRLLTAARALDSTSYVLACGQADPGAAAADSSAPRGIGFSRVVSPFGEVVGEAGAAPELLVVEIDLDVVDQARTALPVLKRNPLQRALVKC